MAFGLGITDVLNQWNQLGVFSYVIPFLLIFAVVYAILEKSKILGPDNRGVWAIIAVSIGLLSLQFDFVSTFFAIIFPRFGVGLSVFLVLLIFIGFFYNWDEKGDSHKLKWIGITVAVGVLIWTFSNLEYWGLGYGGFEFGWWFREYFWSLVILAGVIGAISWVINSGRPRTA